MNRHTRLRGNDPSNVSEQSERGQRAYCSNRGRRGGCGRTFSIFLARVLPRHTLTTTCLWPWLFQILSGLSLKAAAEKLALPFSLETFFSVRRVLLRQLDCLRTLLWGEQAPPASPHADPLLQTLEHLQALFPKADCPLTEFQLRFQRPFLG